MNIFIGKCWLSLLVLITFTSANETSNETIAELREPRVSGRIVKVYSGNRPEPFLCKDEGFQADPSNCAVFYRCVKERSGKFTVFRYQCSPGTVYDPDVETCNHPMSTKRSECWGIAKPNEPQEPHYTNEIYDHKQEIPRPISTKEPIYTEKNTQTTTISPHWVFSTNKQQNYGSVPTTTQALQENHYNVPLFSAQTTLYPWGSTSNNYVSKIPSTRRTTTHSNTGKNEICVTDGFTGDYDNCRKFYRCVGNQRGGFMRYEFYCSELTVWDDELQSCNHPWAVKRSKCGRSLSHKEITTTTEQYNAPLSNTVTDKPKTTFGDKVHKTVQQQLQISHGSNAIQTQTQISHSNEVIQNQTQIHYGDRIDQNKVRENKQNQTQISYGSAVSQSQTQIDYGNKGMQTQLQIDHSKDSSQSQIQTHYTTTQTPQTTQQSEVHGTDNKCSENGFMGDPNNCKKFYRCVDNGRGTYTKYEYMCGDGTVWDAKIESCNHAWAVKECGGSHSTESHGEKHTSTTIKSTYYTEGTKSTQNYYTTQEADNSQDTDVGYGGQENEATLTTLSTTPKSTTTTIKTTAEKISATNNECSSNGFIGDANDCKIFYRCVDNGRGFTKHEFKCGDGTVWDPEIEACNHAWAVKRCGGISSGNKEETTTIKQSSSSTPGVQTTVTLVQTTTQGSNPDEDYDVGYQPASDKPSYTTVISSTQVDNNNDNECFNTGFMGDSNDCKKFYRCVDNGNGGYTRHEFTCGEGTVWDPKIEACNHAWAVEKCGGNSAVDHSSSSQPDQTTESIHTTSMATTIPAEHQTTKAPVHTTSTISTATSDLDTSTGNECKHSGFMGDETDCKKFYRCVDNGDGTFTRYEFTCGEGTVWDSKIEACNHAWAVEHCGGNIETSSEKTTSHFPIMNEEEPASEITTHSTEISHTTQTSTAKTSSSPGETSPEPSECQGNGFYGDKNDCKKFYRCVDNGNGGYDRYEFYCGEGTVWDDKISSCNHAWAVEECGASGTTSKNPQYTSTSTESAATSELDSVQTTQTSADKTSTTTNQNNEVYDDECKKEGFSGDRSNCRKFFRCVDNGKGGFTKYEFTCGEGTVWNQNIQACDHESPENPCTSQSTTSEPQHVNDEMENEAATTSKQESSTQSTHAQITQGTQKPPSSSDQCTSEGFYGDSTDCKRFYRCVDNGQGGYTKYEFICGEGTSWNQEIQACDHESDNKMCLSSTSAAASPSESSTTSSTTTNGYQPTETNESSAPSLSSDECSSDGFFPHPNDCKKFVRCVSSGDGKFTRYEFTCGEGTIWVQEIQACDHDNEQNGCKSSQSTSMPQPTQESSTESSSTSTISTSSTNSENNQIPNKEDDEYPHENPSQSETDKCTSEGYYGDKNDCRKFYRCVSNGDGSYTKHDFVCGEGTAWDSDLQTCNHIGEVESCKQESQTQEPSKDEEVHTTESLTSTSSETNTQKPVQTSSESSGSSSSNKDDECYEEGYFGDSKDCKQFYRCVDNGKGGYTKYDFTCADGTIWDQDISNCNHPQDVANPSCTNQNQGESTSSSDSSSSTSSSTTSSSDPNSSTTESNSQSSSNCSQESSSKKPEDNKNITCEKAGYYANPNDCKKFYRCVDWDGDGKKFSVYHFECGEGTIWDPALDTCNHEESVYPPRDCSRSQSQSETTTEQSTTEESTTEQSTTEKSTTSEQTTTQQSTTSEKTTTEQSTTSEQTTTQQSTTSEKTTTEQSTTNEQTTTQESTTTQKSTTQESTTKEQTTAITNEETTTQQSTTSEQTTKSQESTTSEQTTTEQPKETTQQTTTEQSNEQTTESSTTEQSNEHTTEASTTEGSNEQTTESSTTESSNDQITTQSSTTESNDQSTQSSTTEEQTSNTTDESTTESSTTTESQTESTTEQSSGDKECPETEDDQYVFVCPTSFKRHPKYCNMFYQCTEDDDTHEMKVATFKCPNETIYDESQTQCVEEKKAEKKCDGEMARRQRLKRLSSQEPIIVDKEKKSCPAVGYYSFEKQSECSPAFLKCEKAKSGKLRGFVNQCPPGYIYWNISKRCELSQNVKDCKRSSNDWKGRWNIPVDRKNVAT